MANWEAGFAAMGESLSKTAGNYLLENQRNEAEMAKVTLADQLLSAREGKQREFTAGEAEKQRGFLKEESGLERASREKIASEGHATTLKAAGISAGATLGAAQMNIAARREESILDRAHQAEQARLTREEMRPMREAQIKVYTAEEIQKTLETQVKQEVFDARKDLDAAQKSGDADALKRAQERFAAATYSSSEAVQAASVARSVADQYKSMAAEKRAQLAVAMDVTKGGMQPGAEQRVKALQDELTSLEATWKQKVREADDLVKNMPRFNQPSSSTTRRPLDQILRPGATPGVTGRPAETPY